MRLARVGLFCWLLGVPSLLTGQGVSDTPYTRLNSFTSFFEYSNDSSHILLGRAMNRKIGALGFGYERRLLHRRRFDLDYAAEWRPAIIESDPTSQQTITLTSPYASSGTTPAQATSTCTASVVSFDDPEPPPYLPQVGVIATTCGRRQVLAQALSPVGVRLTGWSRHRLQPTLRADLGVLFSTQPAPIYSAGNFNVFFDFGIGVELYRTRSQSLRLEYLVQHYSNLGTVPAVPDPAVNVNPGVDSGFFKLTFSVGR